MHFTPVIKIKLNSTLIEIPCIRPIDFLQRHWLNIFLTSINAAATATLTFEDGRVETVDVRPDVDLTKQNVGAKVVFEITKVVALSVEKQQ